MSGRKTIIGLLLGCTAAIALFWLQSVLNPVADHARSVSADTNRELLIEATRLSQRGRFTEALNVLQAESLNRLHGVDANRLKARIYSMLGFAFEASVHLRALVGAEQANLSDLAELAAGGDQLAALDELQRLADVSGGDPLVEVAVQRRLLRQRQPTDINDTEIDDTDIDSGVALRIETSSRQSMDLMIQMFVLQQDIRATDRSYPHLEGQIDRLLREASEHPHSWFLAGQVSELRRQQREAVRCYAEAVDRFPEDSAANRCLANSLLAVGEADAAIVLLQRAEQLDSLRDLGRRVVIRPHDVALLKQITVTLVQLGRHDEALSWSRLAMQLAPSTQWARDIISGNRSVPNDGVLIEMALTDPLRRRLNEFPLPDFSAEPQPGSAAETMLIFEDVALASGLRYQYESGRQEVQQGVLMHQFTGGGVGVIDLDADSWPDVWLTQGTERADPSIAGSIGDVVFRNQRGMQFVDATEIANVSEFLFSQGIAVGDINNDGFDDVYIANVGPNSLFLNMGDGTLQPVELETQPAVWTTSVAIADINGDSVADLYDVNYVGGENVFTQTCNHGGRQRVCGPTDFPAQQDRLWLGNGDGLFTDATQGSGIVQADGRGMGIVVGDFQGTGSLQLIVANDESANFHFERKSVAPFVLHETGLIRGIAYERTGSLTGSMGIALGDVNNDQWADVFFTNYYAESNTLHVATGTGFYPDRTNAFALTAAGTNVLGFGTQFLDADLDGDQELFVANGHLDDFSHLSIPFRMLPQLYVNQEAGFRLQENGGTYFANPQLGRSVARLDWNQDGLPDLLISHLDRPAALLTNHGPATGQSVRFNVVGTRSARRPVGATISLHTSHGVQKQWQTSGDGYQCSNESRLCFAMFEDSSASISVSFPESIDEDTNAPIRPRLISSSGHYTIIEGRANPYRIPQ